ncbi:hypothetical protein GCM10011505_30490 [Tistrella bauzanensis]|uniref:DUF2946 domain-containing protein n=2 Tax=Tistrella bauzanensis TaxID=657419 RepID=A0ABQ1IPY4_9PROT|nr:DUF2946 family protein [Tistrella bauzanensis]GGB47256.1 hypothetical protein GCM10011505_30490 [Tistrella bauzanensis]
MRRLMRRAAGWLAFAALMLTQPAMIAGMTTSEVGRAVAAVAGVDAAGFDLAAICHSPSSASPSSADIADPDGTAGHDSAAGPGHHCALCTAIATASPPAQPTGPLARGRRGPAIAPEALRLSLRRRRRRPRAPPQA